MQDLKISLITVTYNAASTIKRCIESVISQNHANVEYIVIDGGSTDSTVEIVNQYKDNIKVFLSEPDKGIYDGMNKGILFATGDVIGTLNADDYFADNDVLSSIVLLFVNNNCDIVYGNLDYVNPKGDTVRKWRSGVYKQGKFNWGWMPPHPAFYCKRNLFEQFGLYNLQFGTAADYELMLRYMHFNKTDVCFLNKTVVKMSIGGVSNKSYINRINAWVNDFKAMRKNGVLFPLAAIIFKPLRKVIQYL